LTPPCCTVIPLCSCSVVIPKKILQEKNYEFNVRHWEDVAEDILLNSKE